MDMKRLKIVLTLLLCLFTALPAHGEQVREPGSYQYSPYGDVVAAVPAYTLKQSYYAADLPGAQSLNNLRDAHVAGDRIYVLRDEELIILTSGFRVLKSISAYTDAQGNEVKLTGASGVTVDREGGIYVSRADAGEILHFTSNGKLKRVIGRPDIKGFENVAYKPIKLVVDDAMRIYVVAQGMYEGIVELNPDGSFSRFFGVNKVRFSFAQYIWRLFATREQLQRQQLWLPTDFTNIAIDDRGFIYATIQDAMGQVIKRLNAKGENILRVVDAPDPIGDLWFNESGVGIPVGPSVFIAVDTNPYGVFICLDQKRSRIFAYNEDGRLLYIIGGPGQREGLFRNPVDADFVGDDIMVLDALSQSIDLYSPTAYGSAINNAVRHQYTFDYEQAAVHWREALNYNHNFTLAYSGIGRSLLRAEQYDEAMEYLKIGDDREYYSKAFEKVRNRDLKEWFVPGVLTLAGLIILSKTVKFIRKRRKKKEGVA